MGDRAWPAEQTALGAEVVSEMWERIRAEREISGANRETRSVKSRVCS